MKRPHVLSLARRGAGALLLALVLIPFYRLLEGRETGPAGQFTLDTIEVYPPLLWAGFIATLIPALLAARALGPTALDRPLRRIEHYLVAPPPLAFGAVSALASAALTAAFCLFVMGGKPDLIDAMSQLLHARYLAAGQLAGPVSQWAPFWHIQNTVLTPNGWVSHYPPGHVVLLALGFRLGAVWLVGPVMQGMTVLFTCLAAERLLHENRVKARLATLFVALSPFMIGLAGTYMNHVTAAAFSALAVYAALRARDDGWWWDLLAGAAVGAVFATRPLAGVVVGAVIVLGVWLTGSVARPLGWRGIARRVVGALAGGGPFPAAIALYNHHFFGSPFRFGYDAALGPAIRLGFHRDPWGNLYGPVQALAYTSSDLVALSLNLLESPFPVVALAGVYLLCVRRLSAGERVIAMWALLPVAANFFYWHHGLWMGPRMLNEAAPAWALLTAAAAVGLVQRVPAERRVLAGRYSLRVGLTVWLLAAWTVGLTYLAPERLASYGRGGYASVRIEPPQTPQPSLVFVHGAWNARVAMLLAGRGMRLDSVETALRRNSICAVHHFAQAYPEQGGAGAGTSVLDFVPRSGYPPGFSRVEIAPGVLGLARKGEALSPSCAREIDADRNGVVDVAPMLWQRDLPGLPASGALLVRDLGPEANAALIAEFPERTPYVLHTPTSEADPILVPYDEGMAAIWGAGPAADSVSLAFDPEPADGSAASDRSAPPRSGRDGS